MRSYGGSTSTVPLANETTGNRGDVGSRALEDRGGLARRRRIEAERDPDVGEHVTQLVRAPLPLLPDDLYDLRRRPL